MAFAKVAKEKCSVDMNRFFHFSDYAYVVFRVSELGLFLRTYYSPLKNG